MKDYSSLWLGIREADKKSFEELFNILSPNLFSYAYHILKNREGAEEIVHDAFINLWNGKSKIIIQGSVKAYLFRSVHNLSVNRLIKQHTERKAGSLTVDDEHWKYIMNSFECNSYLIENIEAEETGDIIQRSIDQLSDQCQKVFKLSRFDNKSNDEISKILGISVNTVRTHIFRALQKIKENLINQE